MNENKIKLLLSIIRIGMEFMVNKADAYRVCAGYNARVGFLSSIEVLQENDFNMVIGDSSGQEFTVSIWRSK